MSIRYAFIVSGDSFFSHAAASKCCSIKGLRVSILYPPCNACLYIMMGCFSKVYVSSLPPSSNLFREHIVKCTLWDISKQSHVFSLMQYGQCLIPVIWYDERDQALPRDLYSKASAAPGRAVPPGAWRTASFVILCCLACASIPYPWPNAGDLFASPPRPWPHVRTPVCLLEYAEIAVQEKVI